MIEPHPPREAVRAAEGMVATSHPLAVAAGVRALRRGGTAADAALAAAAMLCVVEPMMTGIGGDLFALVARDGEAPVGLDAAGPAPVACDPSAPVEEQGPRSVTVPGAVSGWALLAERFGRLGLDAALSGAVDVARAGFAVTPIVAAWWSAANPAHFPPAPAAGARHHSPALAETLERVASEGPGAFYRGQVAEAIATASWLELDDLTGFSGRWVTPLRGGYRGKHVYELPPPTQGVVALEGLGLLELGEPSLAEQVRCVALALEDGTRSVRDGADVTALLSAEHFAARRGDRLALVEEPAGSTVYVAAADADGCCVSLIQSLFYPFGAGVLAGDTGVVLQNRAAGFAIGGGGVAPGRRPYHTIIPGLLAEDGIPLGPFGVVGGSIQAQAHVQVVSAVVDDGADPQAALDRGRFRIDDGSVLLERGLWQRAGELESLGAPVRPEPDYKQFGGGQMILRADGDWIGGSDRRKDGCAAGI